MQKLVLKEVVCPKCHMTQNDRGQERCTTIHCSAVLPTEGRVLKGPTTTVRQNAGYQGGIAALS